MSDYDNEEQQTSEVELNEQDLEQVAGAGGGGYYPVYPPHYFNESIHQVHEKYEFEETDINITQY